MKPLNSSARECLKLFRRQYLQLTSLDTLAFPSPDYLRNESFQSLLYGSIFKPGVLEYPPKDRYQLRVLKELVLRIEKSVANPEEDEVSDELLSHLGVLLASPIQPEPTSIQQKSYVSYTLPVDREFLQGQGESLPFQGEATVTLLESRSLISASGTTGLRTWEAALHLGAYLSLSPKGRDFVRGKRVLELGAGTGFLSILCAKHLDSEQVLATDGDPGLVEALETNFLLNGLGNNCEKIGASVLKWGWALMGGAIEIRGEGHQWDVILGADILENDIGVADHGMAQTYDSAVVPYLVSTLRDLFDVFPRAEVLISATIRNADTFEAFTSGCRTFKFGIEDIVFQQKPFPEQQGLFYSTATPIRILRISRPGRMEDPWAI
ncbi:hypothetical protein FGG08_002630 [Glutinoglossum americanum]|uniref:Uncharacterized protein n=1 Tax=Glutinoglossum americanum TaxID=1670608 RepID=A0A9P8IET5_9PEZI|nr:hypothetical protein FGG08_002630 [Glutinoglossum americanum]